MFGCRVDNDEFAPIKGKVRPFFESIGATRKRDAQKYHDKLQAERWEQDKLGVRPRYTWYDAAAKFLAETSYKRTHEWDNSMLRWFHPYLVGKELVDINRAVLDQVRAIRGKGSSTATVNRYMALVRTILRKACNEWEWLDRVPKVGMFRDQEGRIRSLTRDEFTRLIDELPEHLGDMARFSVATGLRQANVTRLEWKQISLERRHLWVSGPEHKNGRPHSVPLNQAAIDVLEKRRGDHLTHVFTYEGNPIVQVNTKAWRNALQRAGMIYDIPLPPGTGRQVRRRTSYSAWADGRHNRWLSAMLTLRRTGCNLQQVGLIPLWQAAAFLLQFVMMAGVRNDQEVVSRKSYGVKLRHHAFLQSAKGQSVACSRFR